MKEKKENVSVIISFIIVIGLIILVVISLLNKPAKTEVEENVLGGLPEEQIINNNSIGDVDVTPTENQMEQNTKSLSNFTPVSKVDTLEKIDLVVGSGEEVKAGATVSVHYTGAVAGTGVIFQSSKDFGPNPVTFPLSGVIKGWTDGIPGMKVGGIRRLVIPAEQAYGANPPQGSGIPANAALVFDVELVAVK